jgi:hypothetical protein
MMGKCTLKGFVPPDDPMFSEGWSTFSVRSPRSKKTSRRDKVSSQTENSIDESQNSNETPLESRSDTGDKDSASRGSNPLPPANIRTLGLDTKLSGMILNSTAGPEWVEYKDVRNNPLSPAIIINKLS